MSESNRPMAVVFGGSRGIGAACVSMFVKDGYDVVLTYVSQPGPALELAQRLSIDGATVSAVQVDVCDPDAVQRVFATCQGSSSGPIQGVVVNAGINVPPAPISGFEDEAFRRLVEVNLVGAFNVLKAAATNVADGGAIVALTTSLVRHAVAGLGPYSATKAAVECLVRSMAKELAPRGIRVNGVAPGPVDTDLFHSGKTEQAKERSAAMSPLNRIGQPQEIAEVIRFLCSARASWMDGQIVQPNGALV